MIEIMNWIGQDSRHFIGTVLFLGFVAAMLVWIIRTVQGHDPFEGWWL